MKIRERKGPSRGVTQKCEPHERSSCANQFEERSQDETLHQERCARRVPWDLAKKCLKTHTCGWSYALLSCWSQCNAGAHFKLSRGTRIRGRLLSKKDPSSDEMEAVRRSRNTTTVVTADGEVQKSEEAQVYVHDLDLFVTVQVPNDTPAVPSLGKLCEEHGYSYEWVSGQKLHLTKNGKRILCNTENVVPVVVPGLSSSSSASSSSASFPQDSSSSSPSPAKFRSDDTHDQASGDRLRSSKNQKTTMENNDNNQGTRDRLRDLPEWSEVFTDNLEDTKVPALANTSHDSNVLWKRHPGSKVFVQTSLKTEIAKSAREPRLQGRPCRKRTGEAVHSGSQSSQWGRWISKRSPICCRGTGFGHSMDSILSV